MRVEGAACAGLELWFALTYQSVIFLPWPSECLDYRCEPLRLLLLLLLALFVLIHFEAESHLAQTDLELALYADWP